MMTLEFLGGAFLRPVLCALLTLFFVPSPATAGSPEEDYIAARDAAIASIKKIEAKNPDADVSKTDRKALADLEKRLQAIIGPLAVKPYPAKGKIAIETLSDNEVGGGGLDALRFGKDGDGPNVYVTTEGLLAKWIAKPADWWTTKGKTPPSTDGALANAEFYTFAIGEDAAFSQMADLPIEKPAGTDAALAKLGGWAQDIGPNPNQSIIVALRKGGKVYIASQAAKKYKGIPACETVWKEAGRKADALFKKYQDSDAKDEKIFNAYTAEQEKGDKDYRACYAGRLPKEAFFPALLKEAQEIADRFGGQ